MRETTDRICFLKIFLKYMNFNFKVLVSTVFSFLCVFFFILFFKSSIRLVEIDFVTFNLKIPEKKFAKLPVHSYTNEFVFPYTEVQFSFTNKVQNLLRDSKILYTPAHHRTSLSVGKLEVSYFTENGIENKI